MNKNFTHRPRSRAWRFGLRGMLLGAGLLVDKHIAAAPSVIASQLPTTPLTTEWQQEQPDEMDVFTQPPLAPDDTLPQIFRYGNLSLRPRLGYRFTYGNGIQANPGNPAETAIQEISPGLLFNFGSHWALDYSPVIRFYSSSQFHNNVDQALALSGAFAADDWKFGFSQTVALTQSPLVETASQTQQSAYVTGLTASHAFNSRVSADFGVAQNINLVSGLQNSFDWSTLDWVNYQFMPRLTGGLGAGVGYVDITDNTGNSGSGNLNQAYEQLQARIAWRAAEKISFQINGGAEVRQFQTPGSDSSLNPLFGLTIQYEPFKTTQISLTANHTVSASDYYLAAQQTEITTVGLNLTQTIGQKFTLNLGAGYNKTGYSNPGSAGSGSALVRTDNGPSCYARLSHPFFKRGTWALFYQYSDNHSTEPGYSYQSNQVGFELSYRY